MCLLKISSGQEKSKMARSKMAKLRLSIPFYQIGFYIFSTVWNFKQFLHLQPEYHRAFMFGGLVDDDGIHYPNQNQRQNEKYRLIPG